MRREKKALLKARYITDIVTRWKEGSLTLEVYVDRHSRFTIETEATPAEEKQFVATIEAEIIAITQAQFAKEKSFKKPTLRKLCERLHEAKEMDAYPICFEDRTEEYTALVLSIRKYYADQVITAASMHYLEMLERGTAFDDIYDRVWDSDDISHYADGRRKRFPIVRRRMEAILDSWSYASRGALARFIADNQNVHTERISNQTESVKELLLATPIPAGQKTLKEIEAVWLTTQIKPRDIRTVLDDIETWAAKSMITEEGDYLYRKLLQHLWAKIKTYSEEIRRELEIRLYEECFDALNMCAQGHITRLANVLVGFDATISAQAAKDADKSPETMYNRMAEISRLEIPDVEKRVEATNTLIEFDVPMADRSAWTEQYFTHPYLEKLADQ
jgi:hypothetical protein